MSKNNVSQQESTDEATEEQKQNTNATTEESSGGRPPVSDFELLAGFVLSPAFGGSYVEMLAAMVMECMLFDNTPAHQTNLYEMVKQRIKGHLKAVRVQYEAMPIEEESTIIKPDTRIHKP